MRLQTISDIPLDLQVDKRPSHVTYRLHSVLELGLHDTSPVSRLANHIVQTDLQGFALADEFRYASLPICVIDAVFSIGVRYASAQKVVENFCAYTGWTRYSLSREDRGRGEHGIRNLIRIFTETGIDGMTDRAFQNRQRTSSRSGILKAEAVLLFCEALVEAEIDYFTDFDLERTAFAEAKILGLPGQSSGIAFDYFMMLAGDDNLIKPDRMVQRYVQNALSLPGVPQPRQTSILVKLAANELRRRGWPWTPLKLDHAIWRYQSETRDPNGQG